MVHILAPDIDPGRNSFVPEKIRQLACIFERFRFPGALSSTNHNLAPPVPIKKPWIIKLGKVVERRIEVDRRDVRCVQTELGTVEAIQTAEGDGAGKKIGMFEEGVNRVVGPHAAAVGHDSDVRLAAVVADKGDNLPGDIAVVGFVAGVAFCRRDGEVDFLRCSKRGSDNMAIPFGSGDCGVSAGCMQR